MASWTSGNARHEELETDRYFDVRSEIDSLASELAARRARSNDLGLLRAIHTQLASAVEREDYPGMVAWNVRFHQELYRASASRPLVWIGEAILEALVRFTLMPRAGRLEREVAVAQHQAILQALEAGSAGQARLAARIHVETMRQCWRLALGRTPPTGELLG